MKIKLSPPPGGVANNQVYSYLFRMVEQLNIALNGLSSDNFSPETASAIASANGKSLTDGQKAELNKSYQDLRSLIIKTADTVRSEMDVIIQRLHGSFVAKSEFGTYKETVSSEIRTTATEIVQNYHFDAQLSALNSKLAEGLNTLNGLISKVNGIDNYNVKTEQYIRTGLLYFDDSGVPRYGVAVGENLTTIEQNGNVIIERQGLAASFTSDRLSFWQNGAEVAYVSNNKLYINEVTILSRMNIGKWVIETSNGFTLRWEG